MPGFGFRGKALKSRFGVGGYTIWGLGNVSEGTPRQTRTVILDSRRWSSNPSGKCSYERPTLGTVCGTMRSMCGADAGCLAINYQSLILDTGPPSPPET